MRTRIISAASFVGVAIFLMPFAAQAIFYAPGQTLNPACAPTDPTCGVTTTVGSIGPGTAGQVPYYLTNGNALTGTSAITILQNGNVGIGTSTPAYKLDVNGSINALSSTCNGDPTCGPRNVGLVTSGQGGKIVITNDGNATNLFVGDSVGTNTTGSIGYFNTIVGLNSGANIPDVGSDVGHANSFFGYSAGNANTTASSNTFIGENAGLLTTTGNANTAVGTIAGNTLTTGSNNTIIGAGAGGTIFNDGRSITTGNNNVIIGFLQSLHPLLLPTSSASVT